MTANAEATPRGIRFLIGIVGRCNSGKSSLINALVGQDVSIVSDFAGTTTDAVGKPYELLPLGPVTFYDTAGIDDDSELGKLRIKATYRVLYRADAVVLVCGEDGIAEPEKAIIARMQEMKIPFVVAFNKIDSQPVNDDDRRFCQVGNLPQIEVSALCGQNIDELKQAIINLIPLSRQDDMLLAGDLFSAGDQITLVVPLDLSAPKGRLILPQVQLLREILDKNAIATVVKEDNLAQVLAEAPTLVVTDSQVIKKVASVVPPAIPLTTFSILFARNKGDLPIMVAGARQIDKLKDNDKVLIAEACSHHVMSDDIGKVKIPNWLTQYTGKKLQFAFCQGSDFPDNLEDYALVIHCGACMLNRAEMQSRLHECIRRGVPITNYGVAISKTQGVLDRVVQPFGL